MTKSSILYASLLAGLLSSMYVPQVLAEEKEDPLPNWKEETLTGDWNGARASLYKKGVDLAFTHKSDVLSNTSGGVKRGTAWLGHTEAIANLDLEKLLGLNGTSAYVHYHSDLGSKFNTRYVGGFMGVDNIEVATNTAQFYQAWLQKNWLNDNVSLLAGLYAIDSEFYVTETSGLFIQPPYGMANDFAQAGENGPPVFPLGALALRLKLTTPNKAFYVQGAVTDGVPGSPNHPRGTNIKLGHGDGTLSLIEFGYTPAQPDQQTSEQDKTAAESAYYFNKTAVGFWRYSAKFDDLSDVDSFDNPKRRHNQGAYVLAERSLYLEKAHPSQGLAGFVRFGVASDDINQADWTGSLGLNYRGLLDSRDDDVAGVAVTVNHTSSKYRRANDANRNEVDVELTYRAQLKPWLAIQPNLQYIVNPGMDKTLKDVTIVGFRTEVAF